MRAPKLGNRRNLADFADWRGRCGVLSPRHDSQNDSRDAQMKTFVLLLAVVAMAGFGLWSLHVASRYQALCEISYWSATAAQLKHCDERAAELQGR